MNIDDQVTGHGHKITKENQVWLQIWDKVSNQIKDRDNVWIQVQNQVWIQVHNHVHDQVQYPTRERYRR